QKTVRTNDGSYVVSGYSPGVRRARQCLALRRVTATCRRTERSVARQARLPCEPGSTSEIGSTDTPASGAGTRWHGAGRMAEPRELHRHRIQNAFVLDTIRML